MMDDLCEPGSYSVASLPRSRWNVLDILSWISTTAVPATVLGEIDIEAAEELAERLSKPEAKITITSVLLKAISIAQLSNRESRAYKLPCGAIVDRPVPVAGFTVERLVEDGPAVYFANVHNAHKKSLEEIAREVSAYGHNDIDSVTQLTKEHMLSKVPWILRQIYVAIGVNVPALRTIINPATFGLTSLGKFGGGAPVAPNVTTCIFGIGSMEPKPVVVEGKVKVRKMLSICLNADTRVLTVSNAASLLHDVKVILESGLANHLTEEEIEYLKQHELNALTKPSQLPVTPKLRLTDAA